MLVSSTVLSQMHSNGTSWWKFFKVSFHFTVWLQFTKIIPLLSTIVYKIFLKTGGAELQLRTLLSIIEKFEHEGFILKIGQGPRIQPAIPTLMWLNIHRSYLEYGAL